MNSENLEYSTILPKNKEGSPVTLESTSNKTNFSINNSMLTEKSKNSQCFSADSQNSDSKSIVQYSELKLFIPEVPKTHVYTIDHNRAISWNEKTDPSDFYKDCSDLHYPECTDTEYYTPTHPLSQLSRIGLSTQAKGLHPDAPKMIFWHPKHAEVLNEARTKENLQPLPVVKSEFHFVDYLNACGVPANIKYVDDSDVLKNLPIFTYTRYSFFDIAEILMVCSGRVKKEVRQFIKTKKIIQRRQTTIEYKIGEEIRDFVEFTTVCLEIDGYKFRLRLRIIDISAIHGVEKYAGVAANVGWILKYKDNLSKKQLSQMLDTALKMPLEFEQYALGDLDVGDILEAYTVKWKEVYSLLGLELYYRLPRLTIGGTIRDLIEAAIAQRFNIGTTNEKGKFIWLPDFNKRIKDELLKFNTGNLKTETTRTRVLLAKVEGGRCRNNRPLDIRVQRKTIEKFNQIVDANLLGDIDISGCYGEGQRNQELYLGTPSIGDLKVSKNNTYPTLRESLKNDGVNISLLVKKNREDWINAENWGNLTPGGYYYRVRTKDELKYSQDLIASWFTESGHGTDVMAKFIKNMTSDSELVDRIETVDFDVEYGSTKIFENEIHNGVLTHDILQWILGVASARQRNELLDNLEVIAEAKYSKELRIDENNIDGTLERIKKIIPEFNTDKLIEMINSNEVKELSNSEKALLILEYLEKYWHGRNERKWLDAKLGWIQETYRECHFWIGINLGDLLINKLIIERKKAQKRDGKKSPLDILFKLCVNTSYGDLVSPYFSISNPIVGNNITARARVLAWFMEKGFNGFQPITDGCAYQLNGVLYNTLDTKIDGEFTIENRIKLIEKRRIKQKPLGGVKQIYAHWDVEYTTWDKKDEKQIQVKALTLIIESQDGSIKEIKSNLIPDEKHPDCFYGSQDDIHTWIDTEAMNHLRELFPCVDILHSPSDYIKVSKQDGELTVEFIPRIGQFSFETKDIYHSGCFHGSANYLMINPITTNLKMRGHETKKHHESWEVGRTENEDEFYFQATDRYGEKNNPGKDFMHGLLENPEKVKPQEVAVKTGILKIGDYAEHSETYDGMGIEVGDNISRINLLQEFSQTQFTFKTYKQYISWKKVIQNRKDDKDKKQSLETFFTDKNGNRNFQKMVETVYQMIQDGDLDPFKKLDPHGNENRDYNTAHPHIEQYKFIDKCLKQKKGEFVYVPIVSDELSDKVSEPVNSSCKKKVKMSFEDKKLKRLKM